MEKITDFTESWAKRFSAWGASVLTIIIFGLFFFGMWVTSTNGEVNAFNGLLETVKSLAMVAAGYWIGTSNSSSKKDDTIAASTAALASSVPMSSAIPQLPPQQVGTHTTVSTETTLSSSTKVEPISSGDSPDDLPMVEPHRPGS